jgi:mannan endo-1,4-beta-mannosidase
MRTGTLGLARKGVLICVAASLLGLLAPGQAPASPRPAFIRVPGGIVLRGTSLYLAGKPWQFTGVNAPEAATDYAINGGCGAAIDLSAYFASLPIDSVVRVDFDQDETIDVGPGLSDNVVHRDWRGLDQVVAAADESSTHVRLIPYLGTQGGVCDGGIFKTDGWYKSGYKQSDAGGAGHSRSSYWVYLQQVVRRYAGNPAILMWEPMSEPEASVCAPGYSGSECYGHTTCPPDATTTLVHWFDRVGAEVHSLDPGALVETGELTSQQCGWSASGELRIDEAPGVDVASFHDYGWEGVAMPAGLAAAIADAKRAGKPLIVGEVGIPAGSACPTSFAELGTELKAKFHAAMAAGAAGWLPWC